MRLILLALTFSAMTSARADFAEDQYPDQRDILLRIVSSAENDNRFKSNVEERMALYLRTAEYLGSLRAPFGTVHVARLFYIRSAQKGAVNPPRGHTYIVFLDKDYKIRSFWIVDIPGEPLSVDGTKLISDGSIVMDYAHLPSNGTVLLDGKVVGIPQWK